MFNIASENTTPSAMQISKTTSINFNEHKHTGMIQTDLEKAFDSN